MIIFFGFFFFIAPTEMVSKEVQKAKATFEYIPEQEDELKLAVGDIITITDKNIFEGWMQGELNGKVGLFPDNFVELLPLEKVSVSSDSPQNKISPQKSVKRAAKNDPVDPPVPEKPPPAQEKPPPKVCCILLLLFFYDIY